MIIFDLDGTLAECEHRRNFVDKSYLEGCNHWHEIPHHPIDLCDECKSRFRSWKPDWKSFYKACDKDIIIDSTMRIFFKLWDSYEIPIEIWSGRCESVRDKTQQWLLDHGFPVGCFVKMRPIGNSDPDEVLKERWLDDHLAAGRKPIDFVFDDRPKVIRMWRRRGIFVFNCAQHDEEF